MTIIMLAMAASISYSKCKTQEEIREAVNEIKKEIEQIKRRLDEIEANMMTSEELRSCWEDECGSIVGTI